MFSTTCWHLKSIWVRAAAPLLMMSDTENIWRMPTRTSAMIVMARRTSTKLLPRREEIAVRRSPETPRSAILGHPHVRRRDGERPRAGLLRDADAPDRIDADDVTRQGRQAPVDDAHVCQHEGRRARDLPAGGRVDRTPLKVAHEYARRVPAGGVVRPERGRDLRHVHIGQAELLVRAASAPDAGLAGVDDVVLIDEEVRTRHGRRVREAGREDAVSVRVADEVDRNELRPGHGGVRADLDERTHVAALHLRKRPLEEDLEVRGRALRLLALPGLGDLASAEDEDDRENPDDHEHLDEAEALSGARSSAGPRAGERKRYAHHENPPFQSEVHAAIRF